MDEIRWLDTLTAADIAIAGGKGANLGDLTRAGFDVPGGFVVTTAAYDGFVAANDLAGPIAEVVAGVTGTGTAEPAAASVAALFGGGQVPEATATLIRQAYARLGDRVPVAVRSSATAEDLAEASFAGQQDTYLNVVGEDAVLEAVRDCWASLWTDRAIWYRAGHGVDPEGLSLAVVIQRLVPATAAGVMFTANPANGRAEETVITAAWGLGEAVVSGMVDTDTIVVDTDAQRVLSSVVADKAVRIDPVATDTAAEGGTRTSENPAQARTAAVLADTEALRLAGIGAAIAAHFGAPQDIEWVLADDGFHIVQSRPITALPDRVGAVPEDWPLPAKGVYFRASITEQLPDPLTPLFADLMATAVPEGLRRLMTEVIPGAELDFDFPTINGYAFYRYSWSSLGHMLASTPSAMRQLFGEKHWVENRWRAKLADYAVIVAEEAGRDAATRTGADLLGGISRLVDAVAYYYTSVQTVIPAAAMAELSWTGVYDRLLRRPGDPEAEAFLLGYDSEPIRAEKSLYDLSGWVRGEPALAAAVAGDRIDPLADSGPSEVPAEVWTAWRTRLDAHLAEHGHTLYNLDFVNAVPADDPGPVLQALRFYLGGTAPDPYARQSRASAAREAAAAGLLTRLSGWRQGRVRQLLTSAQHTGPLREDALAAMGLFLPPVRRLLRELGGRLVAAGAVAEPLDVCWLTLGEVRGLVADLDAGTGAAEDLRARVAQRREAFRGQRQARPPQYLPKSAAMDSMGWMFPGSESSDGDVLSGNAGSGGVVTARARVLGGPEDFAAFQPGEVLVAAITTPAYTPLFAMAAGVVTDIGGVLSHGSIVAREYGIPAVLGTGSATRLIHTGDEITVDGGLGKVFLSGASAAPVSPVGDRKKWLLVGGGVALLASTVAYFWRRARATNR